MIHFYRLQSRGRFQAYLVKSECQPNTKLLTTLLSGYMLRYNLKVMGRTVPRRHMFISYYATHQPIVVLHQIVSNVIPLPPPECNVPTTKLDESPNDDP